MNPQLREIYEDMLVKRWRIVVEFKRNGYYHLLTYDPVEHLEVWSGVARGYAIREAIERSTAHVYSLGG